jgi:hypothetical protein
VIHDRFEPQIGFMCKSQSENLLKLGKSKVNKKKNTENIFWFKFSFCTTSHKYENLNSKGTSNFFFNKQTQILLKFQKIWKKSFLKTKYFFLHSYATYITTTLKGLFCIHTLELAQKKRAQIEKTSII